MPGNIHDPVEGCLRSAIHETGTVVISLPQAVNVCYLRERDNKCLSFVTDGGVVIWTISGCRTKNPLLKRNLNLNAKISSRDLFCEFIILVIRIHFNLKT